MSTDMTMPQLRLLVDRLSDTSRQNASFQLGESIAGQIQITSDQPIEVMHLRVVFYGHAQVYGDSPQQPLKNGIFDYLSDRQLINTGIRIAKRQDHAEAGHEEKNKTAMPTSCSVVTALTNESGHTISSNGPSKKTPVDRLVESLVRKFAVYDDQAGTFSFPDLAHYTFQPSHTYTVNNMKHRIKYRVPIPSSKLIPSSFSHPHCPIHYYALGVMLCKDTAALQPPRHLVSFAKIPLDFQAVVNVLSANYAGLLRKSARISLREPSFLSQLWPLSSAQAPSLDSDSLFQPLVTQSDIDVSSGVSDSSVFSGSSPRKPHSLRDTFPSSPPPRCRTLIPRIPHWCRKLLPRHHAWMSLQSHSASSHRHANALECTFELPRRAFCRGQRLPLTVQLTNGAGIRIAQVSIQVKLTRSIAMTSNVGEKIESTTVIATKATFYGDELVDENEKGASAILQPYPITSTNDVPEQLFFLFNKRNLLFDMSPILSIPHDSPCTIMSSLTRSIFELGYECKVTVTVMEPKARHVIDPLVDDHDQSIARYVANKHSTSSSPPLSDHRVHVLSCPKFDLVIGNAAF
ncbi:hypothetical protein DM01DRAFT_1393211 [Hesseltinella vesiculosa]|uniref:Uncharacterized protein n=1 Tax=Hesseltinella vesiculosa TaxID=101127 RepID=A0A1X2GCQ2_9FUNG|nr:hypothetical protein DM01DRAFT_1393211 [Hesseltinella vesiculosa]